MEWWRWGWRWGDWFLHHSLRRLCYPCFPTSQHLDISREHYQKNSFGRPPAKWSTGSTHRGGRRVTRGNHHTCLNKSTESDSTESENSENTGYFLSWGCLWCWGCAQQFWSWRYNVTGVEMQVWAVVRGTCTCVQIYSYFRLFLFKTASWHCCCLWIQFLDRWGKHHQGIFKIMIYIIPTFFSC